MGRLFNRNCFYYLNRIDEVSFTSKDKEDFEKCRRLIENSYDRVSNNIYTRVGIEVLGPLITGYVLWIDKIAKENKVDKIFFLSREGEAFRCVYNMIYGTDGDTYLYISRISMIRACIKLTKSAEQLMLLLSGLLNNIKTVRELCFLIGLDSIAIERLKQEKGINLESDIHEINNYRPLYDALLAIGNDTFEENYTRALGYFNQKGIKKGKRILLSDIGWSGTMQYLLSMMFPEVEFIGGYLAVNDFHTEPEYTQLNRKGFICDSDTWMRKGQEVRFTTAAIEALLQNGDGTALGYKFDSNKYRAITETRKDKQRIKKAVENLRKGYLAFAESYRDFDSKKDIDKINAKASIVGYKNFAVYPDMNTVKFFIEYKNLDDLVDANIVASHSFKYYIFHPIEFYREFDKTNAKIIWLKSVFKLPLPYYRFLRFLTEGVKMKSSRQRFNESV